MSSAHLSPPAPSAEAGAPLPLVLVSSCNRMLGGHPFHIAGRKYADAVRLLGAVPLIAPPLSAPELAALLDVVHGVLLTGSPSNVHPAHFGEEVHDASLPLDPERDAWTLPLVTQALARGLPLLAICRGTQEVNIALGGALHQAVHELPGHLDHRGAQGDERASIPEIYAPAHAVEVQPDGLLHRITGLLRFDVNSVHGQGVKTLAPGLRVEAVAPDGLIEACTVPAAPGFNLCVQWHPEWRAADNPVSMRILHAFGQAVHRHRQQAPDPGRARGPSPFSSSTGAA